MKEYFSKIVHYTAGNLFQKIILLIFLPIFTHYLVPEEYAIYTNLMIFISFASLIYFLGIQQAIFSYFYQKKTPEYHYTLISSIIITLICIGVVLSLLIIIFRNDLSILLLRSSQYSYLFVWVSVILFFDVIYGIVLSILNMMEYSKQYVLVGNSKHVLLLVLIIAIAIISKVSVKNIFIMMMITSGVAMLIALFSMISIIRSFRKQIDSASIYSFALMKKILSFGVIMIPGTLAMLILKVSDRYMLTYLSAGALYDVGIYAIGYRIGMIITFLNSIVSLVYFPYAMKIASQENAAKSFRKVFNYYIIAGGLLGILILLFTHEFFKIFIDSAYASAIKIVVFGVISNYLYGIFNIVNLSFYIRKKAKNIALAVGIGALLNIALNFILIPRYGIYGAGIASIISFALILLINFVAAEKLYPVGYNALIVIFITLALGIVSIMNFLVDYHLYQTFVKIVFIGILTYFFVRYSRRSKAISEIFQGLKSS